MYNCMFMYIWLKTKNFVHHCKTNEKNQRERALYKTNFQTPRAANKRYCFDFESKAWRLKILSNQYAQKTGKNETG